MARARFCKGSERPFAARARVLGRISLPPGHIRPRLLVMAQGAFGRCYPPWQVREIFKKWLQELELEEQDAY